MLSAKHYSHIRVLLSVAAASLFLSACNDEVKTTEQHGTVYALSSPSTQVSSLHVLKIDGRKATEKTVPVRQAGASTLIEDSEGQLWVGGKSVYGLPLTTVSLISADLKLQKRVPAGSNPGAGIAAANGKIFIASSKNGFGGSVTEVDSKTLATRTVDIAPPEEKSYILTGLAATKDKIVVIGSTNGPDPKIRYSIITTIDPHSFDVIWRSDILEGIDSWKVIPYKDEFLFLNVASSEMEGKERADILALKPDNSLERFSSFASPLWGDVTGDMLYMYHNSTWNSLIDNHDRFISSFNLKTSEFSKISLPDDLNVSDMFHSNGKLILSVNSSGKENSDGIYYIDLKNGNLQLIKKMVNVKKIIQMKK